MSTSSKSNSSGRKISIGYISAAHGVKGEIRIVPTTDYPERFRQMESLDLYTDTLFVRTLRILRVREHESKGELIVESDLTGRDEAEKLAGCLVLIDPDERVPLPEGRFWVDDLIGLKVQDRDGNVLGEVSDLLASGGNEVYAIRDDQGEMHYIPAVEEFVKKIDLPAGRITVELIEGLW